jgi:outer membrane protein assembly factor BamB
MTSPRTPFLRRARHLGLVVPLGLLAACASTPAADAPGAEPSSDAQETATLQPRLVLTYDGGIQVLDATTLETLADLPLDGFTRVNEAGDGRHVLVSTDRGFTVLDTGVWAEAHGDHAHFYAADPTLTSTAYPAEKPGHVVPHADRTALFDDGTGTVTVIDSADVADGPAGARTLVTPSAHHGVAVELEDGTLVVSEGTDDARTGIRVLDAGGSEVGRSDACPGVHGEAVAADEAVVVGCEDGVLVYRAGTITKVDSPDAYGRIGNQAGTEASSVVLGDYKVDPDAELERPTRVSLVDTVTGTLRLVDLPASYSFRSLGRGPDGAALVLGTDGALHVIDPSSGEIERSAPVVAPWTEPDDWQEPRPTLRVLDGMAYVTDPAERLLHVVDPATGELWRSVTLSVTPNELVGVTGAMHSH